LENKNNNKKSGESYSNEIIENKPNSIAHLQQLNVQGFDQVHYNYSINNLIGHTPIGPGFEQAEYGYSQSQVYKSLIKGHSIYGAAASFINCLPEKINYYNVKYIA
jgi:hypothetical protein